MKIRLKQIAGSRSGDKGKNSNVGVIFDHKQVYEWAKITLTSDSVKAYFNDIVLGEVLRYFIGILSVIILLNNKSENL